MNNKENKLQLNFKKLQCQFLSSVTVSAMTGIAKQLSKMRGGKSSHAEASQEEEELIIYAKVDEAELRGDGSTALTMLWPPVSFQKNLSQEAELF